MMEREELYLKDFFLLPTDIFLDFKGFALHAGCVPEVFLFIRLFVLFHLYFKAGFLCVALAGLELRDPPASASRVLGLKACATTTTTTQTLILLLHLSQIRRISEAQRGQAGSPASHSKHGQSLCSRLTLSCLGRH